MTKPRVKETDQGIQGVQIVETYDRFQRGMRDRGWIETDAIIASGIQAGHALELGPGPGYVGLEWLKKTQATRLTGLDISQDMLQIAGRNAAAYGLAGRVEYVHSNGDQIPFEDGFFDAAFSNGSLHEWEHPVSIFNEMARVVKPGGRVFIADLKRDMAAPLRWFLWLSCRPAAIRPGLLSSIGAAYTADELAELVRLSALSGCKISANPIGLTLSGVLSAR